MFGGRTDFSTTSPCVKIPRNFTLGALADNCCGRLRTISGHLAPWISITPRPPGHRNANSLDNFSTSAAPANEILQRYRVGADQETEELHVASRSDQRFDWVGGLFLLNSTREGLHRYGLNALPDTLAGALAVPYAAGQFTAINDQHVHSRSYAVFGDATYAFTPVWKRSLC